MGKIYYRLKSIFCSWLMHTKESANTHTMSRVTQVRVPIYLIEAIFSYM